MSKVAIIDPDGRALRYGKDLRVYQGQSVGSGYLGRIDDGYVVLCDEASNPDGVVYGGRDTYKPTSDTFEAGEIVTLAMGDFLGLYSADYFSGSTLPSAGDKVYAYSNGLMAANGTYQVGRCLRHVSGQGGDGTSQTLAEILFEIGKP